MDGLRRDFNEREFSVLVEQALPSILGAKSIKREPVLPGGMRPDFIAQLDNGRTVIIEVKGVIPANVACINSIADQLFGHRSAYLEVAGRSTPDLLLVVPFSLASNYIVGLASQGIAVIDGQMLKKSEPYVLWPDEFAGESDFITALRDRELSTFTVQSRPYDGSDLVLERISPGKKDWSFYQLAVRNILTKVLCPPLEQPFSERTNQGGTSRRDIIFPNYADQGFWKLLRDHYGAYFVVIETKNYVGSVKKRDVLQLADYLHEHGVGLFGILMCRNAADRSAEATRREQWIVYRKMIIVLNDNDLDQMHALFLDGADPVDVIKQKIEDFRLSL